MRQQIILLGAGGHARVVLEILRDDERYVVAGLIDANPDLAGTSVNDAPVLSDDSLLPALRGQGITHFAMGIGSVGDSSIRREAFERALAAGLQPVRVIHPRAIVSPSAILSEGVVVIAGAVINTGAIVGDNSIINTSAVVEHDCVLRAHVHVATGARLCGSVHVGEGAHIGAGATVRQGVRIGGRAIVGAGAVVVRDVPPFATVMGVPARIKGTQDVSESKA